MNKVFKVLYRVLVILCFVTGITLIYAAYLNNQANKIAHYNKALIDCNRTPGAIVRYEASTPVFGAGLKMDCEHISARRLH